MKPTRDVAVSPVQICVSHATEMLDADNIMGDWPIDVGIFTNK